MQKHILCHSTINNGLPKWMLVVLVILDLVVQNFFILFAIVTVLNLLTYISTSKANTDIFC